MGDHRASIKIEMHFHKEKPFEKDMWINYTDSGSECEGLDQRVIEFFRNAYHEGMNEYYEKNLEWQQKQREKQEEEIKKEELAELNRLKEKYEK